MTSPLGTPDPTGQATARDLWDLEVRRHLALAVLARAWGHAPPDPGQLVAGADGATLAALVEATAPLVEARVRELQAGEVVDAVVPLLGGSSASALSLAVLAVSDPDGRPSGRWLERWAAGPGSRLGPARRVGALLEVAEATCLACADAAWVSPSDWVALTLWPDLAGPLRT